ncbi:hypothetical protein SAMN05421754_101955 [Nitrosomonas sp. Nm58]|jgi:hypothetical protein|nr:hypothetical protein SAMN05421754_101955 [Nitrosomonas sp. Nm58]
MPSQPDLSNTAMLLKLRRLYLQQLGAKQTLIGDSVQIEVHSVIF